ncbi:hypothetical protein DB346_05050 [Verrucomicrobia bacterium LW23]|nr:hypothetical protein DB346_05050 [Verrucomicrobia bacterium LW23]
MKVAVVRDGQEQIIRLPAGFAISGDEIVLEKRGEEIVLLAPGVERSTARFKTWNELIEHFREKFPERLEWEEPEDLPPEPAPEW